MTQKKTKVKLGLKNLVTLPGYFDYIFVQLRQKARLRPEFSPKLLLTLGPNSNPTRKARPAYNSDVYNLSFTHNAGIPATLKNSLMLSIISIYSHAGVSMTLNHVLMLPNCNLFGKLRVTFV